MIGEGLMINSTLTTLNMECIDNGFLRIKEHIVDY